MLPVIGMTDGNEGYELFFFIETTLWCHKMKMPGHERVNKVEV